MSKDIYTEPAKSYEEMMDFCRTETKQRISQVLNLCLPLADTPEGKILLEEQLYGVLIQMLTYVQANSRRLRREKQREGIDNALANGVHFGRKTRFVAEDHLDVFKRLENGEINKKTAREEIGVSPNTLNKMYRQLKEQGLL